MYTEFGKWLRTLRISIGIRLYDMSKALSVYNTNPAFNDVIELYRILLQK